MSIYQLESGVAIGIHAFGTLVPVYRLGEETVLNVHAGEEAVESPDASIMLEVRTTVQVKWYHRPIGSTAPAAEVRPARSARRGKAGATEVPSRQYHGVLVGRSNVVLSRSNSSLLESDKYQELLTEEGATEYEVDIQNYIDKSVSSINALHRSVRAASIDGGEAAELQPRAESSESAGAKLERRIRTFESQLNEHGFTGISDIVDPVSGDVEDYEGVLALSDALVSLGLNVDPLVHEALVRLPLVASADGYGDEPLPEAYEEAETTEEVTSDEDIIPQASTQLKPQNGKPAPAPNSVQ